MSLEAVMFAVTYTLKRQKNSYRVELQFWAAEMLKMLKWFSESKTTWERRKNYLSAVFLIYLHESAGCPADSRSMGPSCAAAAAAATQTINSDLTHLTEPTNRPLVGQFVFPGEVQASLLAGDERLGSGIGGPGLHPGDRQPPTQSSDPPPALLHLLPLGHALLHNSTETRLAVTSSSEK